jgi:hypothetical protein
VGAAIAGEPLEFLHQLVCVGAGRGNHGVHFLPRHAQSLQVGLGRVRTKAAMAAPWRVIATGDFDTR